MINEHKLPHFNLPRNLFPWEDAFSLLSSISNHFSFSLYTPLEADPLLDSGITKHSAFDFQIVPWYGKPPVFFGNSTRYMVLREMTDVGTDHTIRSLEAIFYQTLFPYQMRLTSFAREHSRNHYLNIWKIYPNQINMLISTSIRFGEQRMRRCYHTVELCMGWFEEISFLEGIHRIKVCFITICLVKTITQVWIHRSSPKPWTNPILLVIDLNWKAKV